MAENERQTYRIRDPIHDLVAFDLQHASDRLAWEIINTAEYQRLRRIKQLGFSELIFPGATHTRFAHCLGAFHIARQLLDIIRKKNCEFDRDKALIAAVAALAHDIGHGPFSHVFEGVQRKLDSSQHHELWGAEIIRGDTQAHERLHAYDQSIAQEIALLLSRKEPRDIYDAVVSSQFDADRLDYLLRDRYMTGTRMGGFDLAWLLDCLETGKINIGRDDEYVEVDGLYLSHKGLGAAEGYLLARFHLYSQVYLHKTTRAAERMLAAVLARLALLVRNGDYQLVGVHREHAIVRFLEQQKPEIRPYLNLDDTSVWSALMEMSNAKDQQLRMLATRLRERRLYKCIDVGAQARRVGGDALPRFRRRLQEELGHELDNRILTDEAKLTAYGVHDYEDPGAFQKVLIGRTDDPKKSLDIGEVSEVVRAIQPQRVFRVYCSDTDSLRAVEKLGKEVMH